MFLKALNSTEHSALLAACLIIDALKLRWRAEELMLCDVARLCSYAVPPLTRHVWLVSQTENCCKLSL
uniref:Uncharacterized protein n=1 Tax=Anguilla anguilla TaxID=7936 RepID=A0A0E9RB96_ANGAN